MQYAQFKHKNGMSNQLVCYSGEYAYLGCDLSFIRMHIIWYNLTVNESRGVSTYIV